MKCDEQKPECFRCRGTGRKCDGYAVEGRGLCDDNLDLTRISICAPGAITSNSISFDLPGNGKERRSFHYFRDRTVPDLSGYFQSEFWNRLVLQFGHAEPAIRHALIALGAVHEKSRDIDNPAAKTEPEDRERRFSLQQYNKAIHKLGKDLSTKGCQSAEVALTCCLLFFCFESVQGNHKSALCHLQSGLEILRSWRVKDSQSSFNNIWISSSKSDIIEDYLVRVFSHLDMQASLFLHTNTRLPPLHTLLTNSGSDATHFIPISFASLDQARNMLEKLSNRLAYFIILNQPDPDRSPDNIPSTVIEEHNDLTAQLQRWSQLFDDLLKMTSIKMSTNELRGAVLLRMQRKTMSLILATGGPVAESTVDEYTGTFTEIASLAESLLKTTGGPGAPAGPPSFSLELGVIAPLYLTARKCSDLTVRQHARSLLYASVCREGLWDGPAVAKIAERVEAVEMEGNAANIPGVPPGRCLLPQSTLFSTYEKGVLRGI